MTEYTLNEVIKDTEKNLWVRKITPKDFLSASIGLELNVRRVCNRAVGREISERSKSNGSLGDITNSWNLDEFYEDKRGIWRELNGILRYTVTGAPGEEYEKNPNARSLAIEYNPMDPNILRVTSEDAIVKITPGKKYDESFARALTNFRAAYTYGNYNKITPEDLESNSITNLGWGRSLRPDTQTGLND